MKILCLYFSGTGNTKYIAELFSSKMAAKCLSIESRETNPCKFEPCEIEPREIKPQDNDKNTPNFASEIAQHDTIAICYPIYGSRVPLIMREFIAKHLSAFAGKKLVIFVTQMIFSGDGARVLTDLFPSGHIEVIYAEHFFMPNNISNVAFLRRPSDKHLKRRARSAEKKMAKVCRNIKNGKIKKRGFSAFSKLLGKIQGKPWQGNSSSTVATEGTMEYKAKCNVHIAENCNACNICVKCCPMDNFEATKGIITQKNNCTACYRCINLCPQKAISVWFSKKPKWQYKGVIQSGSIEE